MNFLQVTPENQHLLDEHEASAAALGRAVEASNRYKELHGEASPALTEIVLKANRRHMDAHQAVLTATATQANEHGSEG